MNAGTILREFYDAVIKRDMVKARSYLDDHMTFVGLLETYPSADAYIATFAHCRDRGPQSRIYAAT